MGHTRYLAFYLLCGIAAIFAQTLSNPDSPYPIIDFAEHRPAARALSNGATSRCSRVERRARNAWVVIKSYMCAREKKIGDSE
jgi:hypothetical protein